MPSSGLLFENADMLARLSLKFFLAEGVSGIQRLSYPGIRLSPMSLKTWMASTFDAQQLVHRGRNLAPVGSHASRAVDYEYNVSGINRDATIVL